MGLRFNENAFIEALKMRRDAEQNKAYAPLESANKFAGTINTFVNDERSRKRQEMLDSYLRAQKDREEQDYARQDTPMSTLMGNPNPNPFVMPQPASNPSFNSLRDIPQGNSSESMFRAPQPKPGGLGLIDKFHQMTGIPDPRKTSFTGPQQPPVVSDYTPRQMGYQKQMREQQFDEAKQPLDLQNLQYQGQHLKSQAELDAAKAKNLGSTGSEFGKAPPGYRWTLNGNLEAIPGGQADQKARESQKKEEATLNAAKDRANLVISKVDEALGSVGKMSTGMGSLLKGVPGSKANKLASVIETIKANLGFDTMAEMKSQSKAGATGLGALSDNEMRLLVAARANLDTAQDDATVIKNLNDIKTHYQNWLQMEQGINPFGNKNPGQSQLMWNGRPLKDTPANRAWLAQQQGGER